MKNILFLIPVCLLVLILSSCQIVSGNTYALRNGQTLSSDLVITGGSSVLEQGSHVTGSLWVSGGSLRANGSIDGDVVLTGGSIAFGSGAVVRGRVQMTGGGIHIAEGASVPPVQSYVPKLPAPIQAYLASINWSPIWPLLILVPGILCFAVMLLIGKNAAGLALPGSILAMLGLVFLFQNTFDQFQTWAYAWALIVPTSVGIGWYIEGLFGNQAVKCKRGLRVARIGSILFILLAAFFEGPINLSGLAMGRLPLATLLILLGALILYKGSPKAAEPTPSQPAH